VGARTDAARAQVVARRAELADELTELEAAGRAAVDIPSKVRKAPAKTAALATGSAFLLLGGPKRVLGGIRRRLGRGGEEKPKSLLPKEVDKVLAGLGEDGQRVRATLEREFAEYLESKKAERQRSNLEGVASRFLSVLLTPAMTRVGRRLAESLFHPEADSFGDALGKVRSRHAGAAETPSGSGMGVTREVPKAPER